MPAHEHPHTFSSCSENDPKENQWSGGLGGDFAAAGGQDASRTPTGPESNSGGYSNASSALTPSSAPASPISHSSQSSETPRRSQTYGRRPEELQPPFSGSNVGQQNSKDPPRPTSNRSTQEVGAGVTPGINVQQATPQANQFSNVSGSFLPGALQPGRPGSPTINTVPSSISALSQSSNRPQSAYPARSSTGSQAHSYSPSNPAGMDQQKYVSYNNYPESSKYTSTPTNKYSSPTPQGDSTHSPLGLADIRPLADQEMSDGPSSANPCSDDGHLSVPTNSNYLAPWAVYAFAWCKWPLQHVSKYGCGKMAIGSYVEDGHNFIQILDTHAKQEADLDMDAPPYSLEYAKIAEAQHSYPVTRILWEPASTQKQSTDLFATSGDYLRLWSLPSQAPYSGGNSITRSSNNVQQPPQKVTPLAIFSSSKFPEHTAPLTSLDWNNVSPSLIITSSIDTTCTLWDIPTLRAKTQLIAHDKEVFDVRFCANSLDVFLSCGADGSVRMFDLRSLEHSTIIYEPSETKDKSFSPANMSPMTAKEIKSHAPPLLRLAASPYDAHLLATFSQDSNSILILDVRQPGQPLLELRGHAAAINCVEWSPLRRGTLASGGDDSLVLIWDLLNQGNTASTSDLHGSQPSQAAPSPENFQGPTASWQCAYEVNNISWAPKSAVTGQGNDWVGVTGGRGIWGVCI